ncbi:MAG: helical backbone metal receptor [Bacteroidia bacterium]|jgi:ABC-type Fe3+-hydroxamate transport system substrate-binding protein
MVQVFTDQTGRTVSIAWPPRRIISLVPSQTELLYDLGLKDEMVGQTLFCIHPDWAHQAKERVGGTKKLNLEKIRALQPDLIIGNKEENERSQIETLAEEFPVWLSDITNLNGALNMMQQIGELVNRKTEAKQIIDQVSGKFEALKSGEASKKVAYFIWHNPWMAAGHDTFINDMLIRCGWTNVFLHEISRYPEISDAAFKNTEAEIILLSSEPFPFKEKHQNAVQLLLPNAQVLLVDGELFSWYGSRLLKSVDYFQKLKSSLR